MSYDPREMETLRGFIEQEQLKVTKRKPRGKKGGFVGAIAKAAATAVVKAVPKVARTAIRQGVTTSRNVVKQLPKVFSPKVVPKSVPNKFQTLLNKVNPLSRSQQALNYAKSGLTASNAISTGLPLGLGIYQAIDYEKQKEKNASDLEGQSAEYYKIQDDANKAAIEKYDKQQQKELEELEKANKKAIEEAKAKYDADIAEKQKILDKQEEEKAAKLAEEQKKLDEAYAKLYAEYQITEDKRIADKLELILAKIFAQQEQPAPTPPVTTKPVTTKPVTTPTTGKKKGRGKQLKGGFLLPLIGLAASLIPTIIEGVEGEKQRKQQDELNRQQQAAIAAQNAATETQNREYARQMAAYRAENEKIERDNRTQQAEYDRQVAAQAANDKQLALRMKEEDTRRIQSEIANRSKAIEKQQAKKNINTKLAEARALQRQLQASNAREIIQQTVVPATKRFVEVAKTNLRRGRGANSETINFIMDYYQVSKKEATKIFKEDFQE